MANQNLKVLMFGWELPPNNTGGLGVACYGLAKSLSGQGISIAFGLPRPLPDNLPFMEMLSRNINGFSVTALNSYLNPYQTNADYRLNYHQNCKSYNSQYCSNIYEESKHFATLGGEWAKTMPHQLIHVHDWMTYPAGMVAAKQSGNPLVAHVHATEFDRTGGNVDPLIADIEYQGLTQANHVIAVSQLTKNIIHDKYSVPNKKISVVHNGIDPLEFSKSDLKSVFPHDKIVLFVGRLTFQKGVDYFLKAAQQVLRVQPNTVFVVAGSGDMEQHLIMQAAYLGIGHRVIFTGFLQGKNLNSIYQMADVFVMPSVSEPYGIVALEAAARQIPTIISKQSGASEALKNVRTYDYWDIAALSNEITSALRYPQAASEWAKNAQLEAKYQTWDLAATKTIKIYQSLLH